MKSKDWVAILLTVGICTALNIITIAVLYDALFSKPSGGLSENATQVLTGWGGGIIGIIGALVGYRAGEQKNRPPESEQDTAEYPQLDQ